jgi:hypothetical protein
MSLLKQVWDTFVKSPSPPPLHLVEFAAVLERVLSYGFNGQGKVIVKSTMRPLFLAESLLKQGLPTIRPGTYTLATATRMFQVSTKNWPTIGKTLQPAIASKYVQTLHFGYQVYQVSALH